MQRHKILPMYFPVEEHNHRRKRTFPRVDRVHLIPVVVLLCFFILWWFGYPVDLDVKDGRVTVIPKVEKPKPISITQNETTRVHMAFLAAAATPPSASISSRILITENQTAAEPPEGTILLKLWV